GWRPTLLHVMPKCSCSASFRSVLREDPDLKHVGMTNKNDIEPVPKPRHQCWNEICLVSVSILTDGRVSSQEALYGRAGAADAPGDHFSYRGDGRPEKAARCARI